MCLEGLPINECTHAYPSDDDEDDLESEITANEELIDGVKLFSGEELSPAQLVDITYANPARLIVIMGEPNCGKTTILASLFDLFQKGTFGPYWFAGSRTQIGFEKRCHLARLASGRLTADTERTGTNDFSFLHLALRAIPDPTRHLLFSDVSGERFRLARNSTQEMEQLTVLKHADRVFCVLDGEQLTQNVSRQNSKANLVTLLNRIEQNSGLLKRSSLYLLINKWDIVVKQKQEEVIERVIISPLCTRFPELIRGVIQICARSIATEQIELGYGYESLLAICMSEDSPSSSQIIDKKTHSEREFSRFASR